MIGVNLNRSAARAGILELSMSESQISARRAGRLYALV